MDKPSANVKSLFDRALEIESEMEDRKAYLDEACANLPEARQKVEALLKAYHDAGSFLDRPMNSATVTVGGAAADSPVCEKPGSMVAGRDYLMEVIGEGGMGVVYMAEQTEPVRRPVALKIIKPGMDTRQVIARFEAERQALALMDHPNIAKVLDAGTTDSGRPLLRHGAGQGRAHHRVLRRAPADAARSGWSCSSPSARRSSTPTRKASSTATSSRPTCWSPLYDDRPVPKVIDFGVAKATGASS